MPVTRQTVSSGNPFEKTYGYARAVRGGDQVFVSGTTARPPHLGTWVGVWLDRGQFAERAGIAFTMPCRDGGRDAGDNDELPQAPVKGQAR